MYRSESSWKDNVLAWNLTKKKKKNQGKRLERKASMFAPQTSLAVNPGSDTS